jgi:putative protease
VKREIELLAPGGDKDSIKAAIIAGADAIYCGIDRFNARNRAANISFDELPGVIRLAHSYNCRVFLTLNIIIVENEFQALAKLLNRLTGTGIDGIIVQDIGLFYLLSLCFKGLNIHASTQLTTHNEGQIKFLHRLGANRVNLSRELNLNEIKALIKVASERNILTEVFIHGSYCISFSGICYMSSVQGGNSGNRGRCSQPCRNRYLTTPAGLNYPLNLKDNSAYSELKDLYDAGVSSLKIEGRIKKFDYVYTVVKTWREHITNFFNNSAESDNSNLYKVFNRDFTNSYMKGMIGKDMFIDNPRDHTIKHLSEINHYASSDEKESDQLKLYKEKEDAKTDLKEKIANISIAKESLDLFFSGEHGTPLKILIKTAESSFEVISDIYLSDTGSEVLDREMIIKRFRALNETGYYIRQLETDNIVGELYIPFSELTSIRNKVLNQLIGSGVTARHVKLPVLSKTEHSRVSPALSVLISSPDDINLCKESGAEIYYQLPVSINESFSEHVKIFSVNRDIIPWFSSVLIGEEYAIAVEFLNRIKPRRIITNNSGIAYEAFKLGIEWIAGPYFNIVNSYSLLGLKENFNCSGSFISNEISLSQIKNIKAPDNFELYYSIYHPILLMTSRQCLFMQVEGCEKDKMDNLCLQNCHKSASIKSLSNETLFIEKEAGNYNTLYNQTNFLNPDIIKDLHGMFSGFSVDLRTINTETRIALEKLELIKHFNKLVKGQPGADKELKRLILNTTNALYIKGI